MTAAMEPRSLIEPCFRFQSSRATPLSGLVWLVDEAIRTSGVEWDPPHLGYTLGPVGGDGAPGDMPQIGLA